MSEFSMHSDNLIGQDQRIYSDICLNRKHQSAFVAIFDSE